MVLAEVALPSSQAGSIMQQTTYGQVPLNLHHRQLVPPLEPVHTTHQQAPSEQLHPPGSSSRGMAAPYAGVGPASAAGGETENARIQRQATTGDSVGGGREGETGKEKAAAAAGHVAPYLTYGAPSSEAAVMFAPKTDSAAGGADHMIELLHLHERLHVTATRGGALDKSRPHAE